MLYRTVICHKIGNFAQSISSSFISKCPELFNYTNVQDAAYSQTVTHVASTLIASLIIHKSINFICVYHYRKFSSNTSQFLFIDVRLSQGNDFTTSTPSRGHPYQATSIAYYHSYRYDRPLCTSDANVSEGPVHFVIFSIALLPVTFPL